MPFQLTLYYILLLSHIIMKIVLVPLFYLSGILQGIIDRPTLFFNIKSSKKAVGITELFPGFDRPVYYPVADWDFCFFDNYSPIISSYLLLFSLSMQLVPNRSNDSIV